MFAMSQPADKFPLNYDPEYATDIGLRMHIPERIGVAETSNGSWSLGIPSNTEDLATMSVPEKIIVMGHDQSVGVKEEPRLHLDQLSFPSMDDFVNISTPPRVLTLGELLPFAPDDNGQTEDLFIRTNTSQGNGQRSQFPKVRNESDATLIRHQLVVLTQQVAMLEDSNLRRSRREMILYPFLLGYVLFRVIQWAMKQ